MHNTPRARCVAALETMIRPFRNGALLLLLFASCEESGTVPSYLELSKFSVASDPVSEGANTSNIPISWVYVNDQLLGVWESASEVPVIPNGEVNVKLRAGVHRNGVSSEPVQYPFYQLLSLGAQLAPDRGTPVQAVFTYQPDLDIWHAPFDDVDMPFTFDVASDTVLLHRDSAMYASDAQDGYGDAAAFYLDVDHPKIRAVSFENVDLEAIGTCWLELDYRTDVRLLLGMYYTSGGLVQDEPYVYIAPSKRDDGGMPWKKIYIDLTPFTAQNTSDRKFYISAQLEGGATAAQGWIDNVKIVRP